MGLRFFFVAVVIVYSFQLFVNASFKLKILYEKKKKDKQHRFKVKNDSTRKNLRDSKKNKNYNKISDFFVHIYSKLVLFIYFVNICLQILVCVSVRMYEI